MRYFLDTEFLEGPARGGTLVRLISLGIVAQDGRELYLENAGFDWSQPMPDRWLHENVLPHLHGPGSPVHLPLAEVREALLGFVSADPAPEFHAWVAAYDWVALMGVFGRLVDRPAGWPSVCRDLKQEAVDRGVTKGSLPLMEGDAHNPLHDARWNAQVWAALHPESG